MSIKVTIEYDHLGETADDIEDGIERALADGAAEIVSTSQAIVPVDTGRLRASLTMWREGSGWAIGTDVEYARYVHDGTRFMAAQPFLRPSFERHRPGIIAACEAAVRRHSLGR